MTREDGAAKMRFSLWLVLAGATIVAGIAVPYGVLAGRATLAVFVFWCVFALAVIALIVAGTASWRDGE